MAQVFLSYDREDGAKARALAQALERAGHSVWWDFHIKGGAEYGKEIEEALAAADAVVVLWSAASVNSAWVRDEAAAGRDRGRLIPILIEPVAPPMGFRQYQNLDFTSWKGRGRPPQLSKLLESLETLRGGLPDESALTSVPPVLASPRHALPLWLIVGGLAMLALVAIGLFVGLVLNRSGGSAKVQTIAVTAADASSRPMARDLLVKLSALQGARSGSLRLLGQNADVADADFIFEAASGATQRGAGASLVLIAGKGQEILWSQDFDPPSGNGADLLQQMAYTAARVTGCALDGLEGPVRLKPAPLKSYLNACAQLAEIGTADPRPAMPMLNEVIDAAPRFTPAWAKLLLAEAETISPEFTGGEVDAGRVARLRQHIAQARRIDRDLPEAAIAEAQLLAPRDVVGRAQRIENAAERAPENPIVLFHLAGFFSETGQMRKAVETAARAVELDPLSPSLQSNFAALLAYSGNLEAARRELAKAEELWPGTASTRDAHFRFHYRYGDPVIARKLFDEMNDSGGRVPRMFLDARQDPRPAKIEPLVTLVRERLRNMDNPSAGLGTAILVFGYFDLVEDIVATLLPWPKPDDVAIIAKVMFRPEFEHTRRDPRFIRVAHRAGLLDYWRQSGQWPDFCSATGQPYDCKAEAAKLR